MDTLEQDEFSPWQKARIDPKAKMTTKLIPNLKNKTDYFVHYELLDFYLKNGCVLKSISKILQFDQAPIMNDYIDKNTNLRKEAKNDFETSLYKACNNQLYGKSMECLRKRCDVEIITNKERARKVVNSPNFERSMVINDNTLAMLKNKNKLLLNKHIQVGFAILELSKLLLYKFHYNYVKNKFGDNIDLVYSDTDSLVYDIRTEDLYADILPDLETWFDTSAYPKDNIFGFPQVNKKVIGKFSDEMKGNILTEWIALRPKMYSYTFEKKQKDGSVEVIDKRKCKGVASSFVKTLNHDDYKKVLNDQIKDHQETFQKIGSKAHKISTIHQEKRCLSNFSSKNYILDDGIHCYSFGHKDIPK